MSERDKRSDDRRSNNGHSPHGYLPEAHDEQLLHQVDRLLKHGAATDYPGVNKLAKTQPQIDSQFQNALEQKLMEHLRLEQKSAVQPLAQQQEDHATESIKEKIAMQMTISQTTGMRPRLYQRQTQRLSFSFLTLAVTLIVLALTGKLLLDFNRHNGLIPAAATIPAQTDQPVQIVIATQDIAAGTTITEDLVGVVTLAAADMQEIRISQPVREYLSDTQAVVGQTAAVDIFAFMPFDETLLGQPVDPCAIPGTACPEVPEGYYMLNLKAAADTVQGLAAGDRVDVLAVADGQLQTLVENVLLADIQAGQITLAAPSWQQAILIWLYQTGESYALRLHTGEAKPAPAENLIDYTFTAPEVIPDNYAFDLIVNFPVSKGYLLNGLPASIENIQYTQSDTTMNFWFTNLQVVKVENGTEVTIRLPEGDAANLDYLMQLHADLTFQPDAGTPQ